MPSCCIFSFQCRPCCSNPEQSKTIQSCLWKQSCCRAFFLLLLRHIKPKVLNEMWTQTFLNVRGMHFGFGYEADDFSVFSNVDWLVQCCDFVVRISFFALALRSTLLLLTVKELRFAWTVRTAWRFFPCFTRALFASLLISCFCCATAVIFRCCWCACPWTHEWSMQNCNMYRHVTVFFVFDPGLLRIDAFLLFILLCLLRGGATFCVGTNRNQPWPSSR